MTTTTTHTHHWIIEPAHGKTSKGVCLHCGEIREFKNYIDSFTFWAIADEDRRTEPRLVLD